MEERRSGAPLAVLDDFEGWYNPRRGVGHPITMPSAIFFNVPAHGHINPSLPLVAELTRRGHAIVYLTTESFRARVEATGARVRIYQGIGDDYFGGPGLDGSQPQYAARALLATTQAILPELLEAIGQTRPDYALYDSMCPWGYFAARIAKLPSVSSASLLPLSPRMLRDWRVMRLALPMLVGGLGHAREAGRLSRALAEQYRVPPLGMMSFLNVPADLVISYSSAAYVPYAESLPGNVRLTGWTLEDKTDAAGFVHEGEGPLIYASLGTLINANPQFYRACIAAFAGSARTLLISTGGRFQPDQFGTLPPNVTLRSWVPQAQVLRQASLFITHGGLNSLHDGLYCGLPLLIVPQQAEQTVNGLRVVQLGAGLMIPKDKVTPDALRAAADRLLGEPRFAAEARRIGESFRAAGGVSRAADEIEALLASRKRA